MGEFIADLLSDLRMRLIQKIVKPYTTIKIPFVAKSLAVTDAEVESLLVTLILDGEVKGKIDQVNGLLVIGDKEGGSMDKFASMRKVLKQLKSLEVAAVGRLHALTPC